MSFTQNTAMVGDYTLTVSMSSLYFADTSLKAAEKPTVIEIFGTMLEVMQSGGDVSDIDIIGLDFETFAILICALLKPVEKLSLEECIDKPLNKGMPQDWIKPLYGLLEANMPHSEDIEAEGNAETESVGNDEAA